MLSEAVLADLREAVGSHGVINDPGRLLVYESDGLTAYRRPPAAVVLPRSTEEVARVVRRLAATGTPFVARGAGTGLSGGCLAGPDAVVIGTARMNRILDIDPENRTARVQPGVVNAHLTEATRPLGLYYAPDPSSQSTCTLGGNVAENSGGPHCLKYGVTSRYVTGLTVVLPSGECVELGGLGRASDLDLVGLFVGSEGTFGIATEIETRLLPLPESVRTLLGIFDRVEDAGRAVTDIMARGLLPAALEIIDGPTIRAVEASVFAAGYPVDAGAALVVEFDGLDAGLDRQADLARGCCLAAGAREVRIASTEDDRMALWKGRKKAFGAMGRIAPDLLVQDATVPRTRLPEVLARIEEIGARYQLKVANVFHAGDGNLHPNILFDRRDGEEVERVEAASREIMQACVEAGGTITGEHGVGIDKRNYMHLIHGPDTLDAMATVKLVFDPEGRSNPGKVLPDDVWVRAAAPRSRTRSRDRAAPAIDRIRAALAAHARVEPGDDRWRTPGGPAPCVAFPSDTDQVAAILRACTESGLSVGPAGAGSWLGAWGLNRERPGPVDVVVSTEVMDSVVHYEPADLTVTAGAGVTLDRLARVAAEGGQWLAVDAHPAGTLGGLVATASSGGLVAGFGATRDHVLGLTVVTGDGRVLELGGRVVKNVAGFDLLKLVIGSWGTLGVVTQVTVRLFPLPQADCSLIWQADRAADLVGVARSLATSSVVPDALELVTGGARATGAEAALVLRALGTAETVARSAEIFQDTAGRPADLTSMDADSRALQAALRAPVANGAGPDALWQVRRRPSELAALARLADASTARTDLSVTEGLLELLWDEEPSAEERSALVSSVAAGSIRYVVGPPGPVGRRPQSAEAGGSPAVGSRSVGPPRASNSSNDDHAVARLVRGLGLAFDPAGILWPLETRT